MFNERSDNSALGAQHGLYYGWVIVAASCVVLAMQAGILYSFGVFFKPLVADFGWSRGATAGVYSAFMVSHGVFAIPAGWLADRFGPSKVMVACAILTAAGLMLTSQVSALWQIYLTYGFILGLGLSGPFVIGTSSATRWFAKRRGLALGIVTAGIGLGTLIVPPLSGRLITAYDWSRAYLVLGIAALVVMSGCALLLKHPPKEAEQEKSTTASQPKKPVPGQRIVVTSPAEPGISIRAALGTRVLWTLVLIYFLFSFCLQMVMIHLVNYATDMGISVLVAATFMSLIGLGSTVGRVAMGTAADRVGSRNALLICCSLLALTLAWLLIADQLWMLYLFSIVFGFAYGGEVPQMAALVGYFFGLRAVAALVGAVVLGATFGGALGAWTAGWIFDTAHSYDIAYAISVGVSVVAVAVTMLLRKQRSIVSGVEAL